MPQIKEYTSRTSAAGPVSPPGRKSGNPGSLIAEGIQNLGRGIGVAGQYVDQANKEAHARDKAADIEESRNFLVEKQSKYAQSWAETAAKADPNDRELATKFLQKFDEESSEFPGTLRTEEGKEFYRSNLSQIRAEFFKTASAGQAQLASVAAKQNYLGSLNLSSAALINDPSSFNTVKNLHGAALDELGNSGTIPRDKAIELKLHGELELAKSAIRGWMKISPSEAKSLLDGGAFDQYIGGDTKKQLYGELAVEENARELKRKQYESDQKKAAEEAQRATYDQFVDQMIKGKLTVDNVLASNLSGEKKEHFFKAIEKATTRPSSLRTDPDRFHDLYERIAMTGSDDPTAIVDEEQLDREFQKGGVSFSDLKKLREELNRGKSDDGKREREQRNAAYQMMKETIYRGAGPKDPQAPELYLRAQQAYDKAVSEGLEKGKTMTELTDPDFIKKVMKPFVRTPQVKLKETAKQVQKFKAKTSGKKPADIRSKMAESLKKRGLGG